MGYKTIDETLMERIDDRIDELKASLDPLMNMAGKDPCDIIDDYLEKFVEEEDWETATYIKDEYASEVSESEFDWHLGEEEKQLDPNIYAVFHLSPEEAAKHIRKTVDKYENRLPGDSRSLLFEYLQANYRLYVGNEISKDKYKRKCMSFIQHSFSNCLNVKELLCDINKVPNSSDYISFLEELQKYEDTIADSIDLSRAVHYFFMSEYKELLIDESIFSFNYLDRKTLLDTVCGERGYQIRKEIIDLEDAIKKKGSKQESSVTEVKNVSAASDNPLQEIETFLEEWPVSRIYEYLDRRIIKQEAAKKEVALFLREHFFRVLHPNDVDRKTICLVGPPGSGKTQLFRVAKELCPRGMIDIVDISACTQRGYIGSDAGEIFKNVLKTNPRMRYGILLADELHQLCQSNHSSDGDDIKALVLGSLYKIIEDGYTEGQDSKRIDIGLMEIAFAGAFLKDENNCAPIGFNKQNEEQIKLLANDRNHMIAQQLISYGMTEELARRISCFVKLERLEVDDYYEMMNRPEIDPCMRLNDRYRRIHGVEVYVNDEARRNVAKMSYKHNLGVPGMRSILEDAVKKQLFKEFEEKTGTIEITGRDFSKSMMRR